MKKMLGLLVSLTAISGACAAVLAYVNSITAEPIAATAEKAREAAKAAVLCGEEGYTAEGRSGEGYGGDIVLMVGFKKDKKTVISYKVLQASETPGLGMKLKTPEFSGQFSGKDGSALKVKKDGGDIEAITSATITSRAVCKAIADAQSKL
ncbi:MAG: FMN-binding protein [Kiritimatiellae bacterium]|jgi:electron transport complex protein RnfG|nr:FMN-binding protein [Kiritimatiellia bacterium]